jgi:hypothetical protein
VTHHGAAKTPHILKELDADCGVRKEESEEKFVRNSVGAKRRAPIGGGWNKSQPPLII